MDYFYVYSVHQIQGNTCAFKFHFIGFFIFRKGLSAIIVPSGFLVNLSKKNMPKICVIKCWIVLA